MCNWMNSVNQRMHEKREVEAKMAKSERCFKTLRLHTIEEKRRSGRAGKIINDQKTINEVLFEYMVKLKMSLPDGKNVHECCYWWHHNAIHGKDILEAFENYLEGNLTKDFESCRGSTKFPTKVNVS